jgi:hypothetical protein
MLDDTGLNELFRQSAQIKERGTLRLRLKELQ